MDDNQNIKIIFDYIEFFIISKIKKEKIIMIIFQNY